jgi:hypothetical protein
MKMDYIPIFDMFLFQIKKQPEFFEMKLALVEILMPMTTKDDAHELLKIFE